MKVTTTLLPHPFGHVQNIMYLKTKLFGSRQSFLLNGISQPEHTVTLSISITKWGGM